MKHRHGSPLRLALSRSLGLCLGLLGGCSSDQRLADLAEQVTHEQAAQNERMLEASGSVAAGTQKLVHADAQARRELINLQHALRDDQAHVAEQRDALELERKEIAEQRLSDSLMGSGLIALGAILAALAPLLLASISLIGLWREPTPAEEGHILIEELSRELRLAGARDDTWLAASNAGLDDSSDTVETRLR